MKILYVGTAQGFLNADKIYLTPQKLIQGFTRNGHCVYPFNDKEYARYSNIWRSSRRGIKQANEKLIDVCRQMHPDLIVLGHCKHIANETLEEIRSFLPDIKIIYRNVDPLHSKPNVRDIHQRVGVVDGIFITTAGQDLAQFSHPKTFVCHMPNMVDPSVETGRAFEHDGKYDFFFAGSVLRDQYDQRQDVLALIQEKCSDMRLGIYGANQGQEKLFGHRYLDTLANSKMGLCINKTSDYYLYSSGRMTQYMGQGLLIFHDRGAKFEDIFGEDEIGFYDSPEELVDKIRYYHKHDQERRKVAKAGWEKAHRIFNNQTVTKYIIERTFDIPLSQDYVWPTNVY